MSQLDPEVQIRLIDAVVDLLGMGTRLRSEDHARKYMASFRYLYCGLSAAVAKGETRTEGEPEECFLALPPMRSGKRALQ
ncbi:MAG: hypothetical protein JXA58_01165 [Dehalococcoidia bacterium]|nr:hypothetical protein [Dehalococcoidia bacterium]